MVEYYGMPYENVDGSRPSGTNNRIVLDLTMRQLHKRERYLDLPDDDALIKSYPPPANEAWLRDTQCPYLYLRLRSSGAKSFYYRHKATKAAGPWEPDEDARRELIGNAADYTLDAARQKAELMRLGGGMQWPYPKHLCRNTRLGAIFLEFKIQHPSRHSDWFADRNSLLENHLLPQHRDNFLTGISRAQWEAVIDTVTFQRPARAPRFLKALKSFLSWTVQAGYLKANPLAKVSLQEMAAPVRTRLTLAEICEIRVAARLIDPPWNAIFELLISTGEAFESVRYIHSLDFSPDFQTPHWNVNLTRNQRLGGGAIRTVPLSKIALELLTSYRHIRGLLFQSTRTQRAVPINLCSERIEQLRCGARIQKPWGVRELRRSILIEVGDNWGDQHSIREWQNRLDSAEQRRPLENEIIL